MFLRRLCVCGVVAVVAGLGVAGAGVGVARGGAAACAQLAARRSAPPVESFDPKAGAPRIFAMQYKQDARNVVSYASFRTKIECLLRRYVLPHLAADRPNVVVFNEDIGLATFGTGSRGAAARTLFAHPGGPGCSSAGGQCGTLGALFATSLPAFTYGTPAAGVNPCSDTSLYYMRCLDKLGAKLVIQDEANPGSWTGPDGNGIEKWQPLSWMASTYRTVSDPSVHFDWPASYGQT